MSRRTGSKFQTYPAWGRSCESGHVALGRSSCFRRIHVELKLRRVWGYLPSMPPGFQTHSCGGKARRAFAAVGFRSPIQMHPRGIEAPVATRRTVSGRSFRRILVRSGVGEHIADHPQPQNGLSTGFPEATWTDSAPPMREDIEVNQEDFATHLRGIVPLEESPVDKIAR